MDEVLIVLAHDRPEAAKDARKKLEAGGGQIRQSYGPHVLIVDGPTQMLRELASDQGVAGVYPGAVPEKAAQRLDDTGQMGIAAWNQRHSEAFQKAKSERKGEGRAWDDPDFETEGRQEP